MDIACRVCLQLMEPMVHIYQEDLCSMLEAYGGLVCDPSDDYSSYLCKECTSELLIAAKFREKCARSSQLVNSINEEELIEELGDEELTAESTFKSSTEEVLIGISTTLASSEQEPIHVLFELCNEADEELITFPSEPETETLITEQINLETKSKFECDACGAKFVQASNLRRHIEKTHKASVLYICGICAYSFTYKAECDAHCITCGNQSITVPVEVTSSETSISKKRHECAQCGKMLQSPFALRMHERTHTGDRPFACTVCGKAFSTRASLTSHSKRHAGKPDFFCHVCGKCFYDSSNLSAHLKIHTGDKPHKCKVCGLGFSRVFLLEVHARTHTGEKPYQCDLCERAFAQLCDLRNHKKTHTGQRDHHCPFCERTFIKRRALNLHMVQHE